MQSEFHTHTKHIRKHIIEMITAASSGHPGGSLSATDLLTTLFFEVMNLSEENVNNIDRDRFVLSKGHAAPLLYAILAEKGLLPEEELLTLRQLGSRLQGHPNMHYIPGVDMSTGSLGQGISAAVGMALANKIDNKPYRIYTLLGDGECEEGQVWEAAMAAAHYQLDNLCAILDFNGLQIDGNITSVMNPTPFDEKFKSFGWEVITIDGHHHDVIYDAFQKAALIKGKPTLILAHTVKGKGVSFMENEAGWHGSAPNDVQCLSAIIEIEKGGC